MILCCILQPLKTLHRVHDLMTTFETTGPTDQYVNVFATSIHLEHNPFDQCEEDRLAIDARRCVGVQVRFRTILAQLTERGAASKPRLATDCEVTKAVPGTDSSDHGVFGS